MKNLLIGIGIFSAGAAVGVLATRSYFDKMYKELADEEIESCRAVFEKRKAKKDEETTKGESPVVSLYDSGDTDNSKSYSDFYGVKTVLLNEAKTLSPVEDDIYEISVEDFSNDDEFNKVTLNYYMDDGMLIYEEGEEIAEESIVGSENLDDFANVPIGQAYFRDPKRTIDYEVIKVDGSYHELIAGNV